MSESLHFSIAGTQARIASTATVEFQHGTMREARLEDRKLLSNVQKIYQYSLAFCCTIRLESRCQKVTFFHNSESCTWIHSLGATVHVEQRREAYSSL